MTLTRQTLSKVTDIRQILSLTKVTDIKKKKIIESMLRVNQSGELAAVRIYKGQIMVHGDDSTLKVNLYRFLLIEIRKC